MPFDACPHLLRLVLIRAGQLLHPEEKDLSVLIRKVSMEMGMGGLPPLESFDASHTPSPEESLRERRELMRKAVRPRPPTKECPQCRQNSFELFTLCRTCQDAEGGKYKTIFVCSQCGFRERSELPTTIWLDKMKQEFEMQTKETLGIRTVTDEGIK